MNLSKLASTIVVLAVSTNVNASLIGDNVTAEVIQPNFLGFTIDSNFGSGLVGEGVDFTAVVSNSDFNQIWDFSLDVFDSGFTVGWTEQNKGGSGNVTSTTPDMIRVALSDLDWMGLTSEVTDVILTDYTCSSPSTSCSQFDGGPSNTAIMFGPDSLYVDFQTLRHGEQYTFGITASPVPVPAAVWLFGSGLLGLFGIAKQKRRA